MTDNTKGTAEPVIRGQGMTREDAVEALKKASDPMFGTDTCSALVAGLVALGLLKLEEPKPEEPRLSLKALGVLATACEHLGISPSAQHELVARLHASGLRFVEGEGK